MFCFLHDWHARVIDDCIVNIKIESLHLNVRQICLKTGIHQVGSAPGDVTTPPADLATSLHRKFIEALQSVLAKYMIKAVQLEQVPMVSGVAYCVFRVGCKIDFGANRVLG